MQLFNAPPGRNFQPVIIPQDVAVYRIKEGKFFCDDVLYEEGSIIAWADEPNQEMEPLNAMAIAAMKKYLLKLDGHGRAVAAATGKMYISLSEAFSNAYELAKQEGKKVTLLNGREEPNILGKRRTGPTRAKQLDLPADIATTGTAGPLSVDGRQAVNSSMDTGIKGVDRTDV